MCKKEKYEKHRNVLVFFLAFAMLVILNSQKLSLRTNGIAVGIFVFGGATFRFEPVASMAREVQICNQEKTTKCCFFARLTPQQDSNACPATSKESAEPSVPRRQQTTMRRARSDASKNKSQSLARRAKGQFCKNTVYFARDIPHSCFLGLTRFYGFLPSFQGVPVHRGCRSDLPQ